MIQGKKQVKESLVIGWVGFNAEKQSKFYLLEGDPNSLQDGITGRRYLTILQETLSTIVDKDNILLQDNAPIHKVMIV